MPIYTPNGLKIRLDPDKVHHVIKDLIKHHNYNDMLLDVELWENFPRGLGLLSALSTSVFISTSPVLIALFGLAGFLVGSFCRGFIYSDIIRICMAPFQSWIIGLVLTLSGAVYMVYLESPLSALALVLFFLVSHHNFLECIRFPFTRIRVSVRSKFGLLPSHQEEVFIKVCNARAAKYGLNLNWERYHEFYDLLP